MTHQLSRLITCMNSHFACDDQLPADCETWRHLRRHIVRMQNALTLVYLTLRDERELGIPLTPETAGKLQGYAGWGACYSITPVPEALARTWGVHIVFTLPAEIGAIAYQNKAVIYDLLFKASSDTMLTIAADPEHLGAKIGITAVLHTWGSAMTHHPHVHMIVTGGGISPDGSRWIASQPDYLVPVEVLSALFRGRMLGLLIDAHVAGRLQFYGDYQHLAGAAAFKTYLAPLWKTDWFVYAERPFAGPEQVLAYLSRYTHRVAISNSRLISADVGGVTFKYKDYRIEGPERYKTMTIEPGEFIRRFLMHVLPKGFHRIRHYGLLANGGATRAEKLARARQLIAAAGQLARELIAAAAQLTPQQHPPHDGTCEDTTLSEQFNHPCPHCGSRSTRHDAARHRFHPAPLSAAGLCRPR